MQHAAIGGRPEQVRQIVHPAGRKSQTVGCGGQPGCIGHGRHFNRRLGTVQERIEHLRVHAPGLGVFGRDAVVRPHGLRCRGVVLGQILGPLARGHDLKACRPRPIDHLADQRGLIAIGERIHDSRFARAARQQGAGKCIRFHVHHHDVLAMLAAGQHMGDPRRGAAGGIDHDIDLGCGNHCRRVVGQACAAISCCRSKAACGQCLCGPAGVQQGRFGPRGRQVGDGHQMHTRRAAHLRQIHGPEFSGADQADTQGFALGSTLLQQTMQVHPMRLRPLVPGAARRCAPSDRSDSCPAGPQSA